MATVITNAITAHYQAHPILVYIEGAAVTLTLVFFTVVELFKPAGTRRMKNGEKSKLPPGPPGYPIFGHMPSLMKGLSDYKYTFLNNLHDNYGEMATVHLGEKTWVFLNSHRVAQEIIVKRGSSTNSRSHMPVASGIVSRGMRSILMPQDKWTEPRRVMHHLLSGSALAQYAVWQERQSTKMLAEYILRPDMWYNHHLRFANSVVQEITFGEQSNRSTKELVEMQKCANAFVKSIGKSLVDWFPSLEKYLPRPLHLWRDYWEKQGQWNYDVYRAWFDPIAKQVADGTAPPSFVRDALLNPETRYKGTHDEAMYAAMQVVEAGSETTRAALGVMVMAAMEYPDIFAKARADIDRVCGVDENARLPGVADMDDLRYICAMVKEALRWRPVVPVPPEHCSDRDIEFDGYLFPAGTSFVLNGITLSKECEDPQTFIPERWLDGHETEIAHGLWQFGGGRRICPGYRLAQRSLFINFSRLIQCIDFTPNGPYNPMNLGLKTTDEPFPVKPSPRSPIYEKLILDSAKEAGVLASAEWVRDNA